MRSLPLLVVLVISASLQAEEKRGVHDAIDAKLKEEFRFDTCFQTKELEAPKDEILLLEKLTVIGSVKWRLFEQSMIQEYKERLKDEKFTLRDGGPFASKDFGKVRAQIGLWGEGGGFTFLKFRW